MDCEIVMAVLRFAGWLVFGGVIGWLLSSAYYRWIDPCGE